MADNEFIISDDTLLKYTGSSSIVKIPRNVKYIGKEAFYGCREVRDVLFYPQGILGIGDGAFALTSIDSIKLPASVKKVNSTAFLTYEMSYIDVNSKSLYFSSKNGVLFSKDGKMLICYPRCCKEIYYAVPDGVEMIMSSAFYSCEYLQKVTIPESVRYIGSSCFSSCHKLDYVIAKNVDMYIDSGCFEGNSQRFRFVEINSVNKTKPSENKNSSETPISYSKSDFRISGTTLFEYRGNSTTLEIPDGVETVSDETWGNLGIKKVHVPASVHNIGNISNCTCLEEIFVDEKSVNFKSSDDVLFSKDGKKLICYPRNKKDKIFYVPEGTEAVFDKCFRLNCYIERVVLSSSMKTIGNNCFASCDNLAEVVVPQGVNSIGDYGFRKNLLTVVKRPLFNAFNGKFTAFHIVCSKNSYADQYAKQNKIPCKYI